VNHSNCVITADARTEQVCNSRSRPWSLRRSAWSGQWELGIPLPQTLRTTISDTGKTTIGARSTSAAATGLSPSLESEMAKTGSAMTKTQTSKLQQRNPGEFTHGSAQLSALPRRQLSPCLQLRIQQKSLRIVHLYHHSQHEIHL